MAELINLAGTTSHSFTIGGSDGITKYFGNCVPTNDIGKVGDLYIQVKTPVEGFDSVADLSALNNYDTTNLYNGFYIEVRTDSDYDNHSTIYVWKVENDSSEWDFVYDEDDVEVEPLRDYGKLYIKTVNKGVTEWFLNEKFEYDTPIIKTDEIEPGVKKVNLQSATNTKGVVSSTQSDDYKKNHDNFGVTRFGTNAENVASDISNYQTYSSTNLPTNFNTNGQKFMDKYIALTPKQVADNIKVEMKRAITVEGTLNSLNSPEFDNYKTDLVTAINHENTRAKEVEGTLSSLNTGLTKTNLVSAINSENTRAKGVEGTLSNLTTEVKTNLVAAINSEVSRATGAENGLQDQIDAIVSKSDVVDVVSCYNRGSDTSKTDIVHYDTSSLGDNDVIKVLIDETHNDATTYYRWDTETSQFAYIGPEGSYYTKAEADDRFVNATDNVTETINGNKTFSGTTTVSGSISLGSNATATKPALNDNSTKVATTNWVNDLGNDVVHKTGAETITGEKTFNNKNVYIKSQTLDRTNTSTTDYEHLAFLDKNGLEIGHVKSTLNEGVISTDIGVTRDTSTNAYTSITIYYDTTTGTTTTSTPQPTDTNSTSSTQIATVGWASNSSKSTNIVHRDGTETITGAKTFTGAVNMTTMPNGTDLTVKTQTRGDSSTKAASTAFVADGLSLKVNIANMPAISSGTAGQVIACPESGNNYVWKTVRDITTIGGLDDTAVENEEDDQSLVYNGSTGKWCNKRPTVAVISYW